MLSRKASCDSHGQDSSYFVGWQLYENNPYHQLHNPNGIVQMGLAENQCDASKIVIYAYKVSKEISYMFPFLELANKNPTAIRQHLQIPEFVIVKLSFDILESWVGNNPDSVGLKRNGFSVFRELALFQDYNGLPAFKNALVEFMAEIRRNKVKFDPKNLVLTAGSTSANETLMFCLAERGDAFLLPAPYYPGFDRDLKWRTEVEIVPIHCSSSNGFRITMPALERAYQQALKLDLKVKGILITNPSNPLGTSMSRNELNLLISFAMAKQIHIVSDEIYSGTVFDHPNFVSITEAVIDGQLEKTDMWKRIHIVYGLSKDLGLSGFRVGMIYSNNEIVISAATKMSSFGLVSSQTQHLLSSMLSDKKFRGKYLKENQRRLKQRKDMLVSGLENAGISCLKSNAGLFCWVDMRHLLSSPTFEAEKELWRKILGEVGLNISPGSSCHCPEPGWFRICFANISEETLNVAMGRIKQFAASSTRNRKIDHQMIRDPRSFSNTWVLKLSSRDIESDR